MNALTIFNETITHWNIGICCGGVAAEVLADPVDVNYGNVVEFNYSADTTVTFFQSSTPSNLSAWAGGTIEFDLFIEACLQHLVHGSTLRLT